MHYALYCIDKPGALELRKANRDAHLAYAHAEGSPAVVGGPLFDDAGEAMIGSMLILAASSLEAAQEFAANDPYAKAGLFETVTIRPWKWVIGAPE